MIGSQPLIDKINTALSGCPSAEDSCALNGALTVLN